MRGASRGSLVMAREQLTAALAAGADPAVLGEELFAVTHLLDREPGVRRALTEATSPTAARSGLARRLLDGRVSGPTLDLVDQHGGQPLVVAAGPGRRGRGAWCAGHRGRGRG